MRSPSTCPPFASQGDGSVECFIAGSEYYDHSIAGVIPAREVDLTRAAPMRSRWFVVNEDERDCQQWQSSHSWQHSQHLRPPQEDVWAGPYNCDGYYQSWNVSSLNQATSVSHGAGAANFNPREHDAMGCGNHYHQYSEIPVPHHGAQPPEYRQSLQPSLLYPTSFKRSCVGSPPSTPSLSRTRSPSISLAIPDDTRNTFRRANIFPEKLMKAFLEFPNEDAVAWLPDGKSFVIVNQSTFVTEILSKVFKATKYSSFIRKLHRWGYIRLASGTGTDCFHHPLFTINDPKRAGFITCSAPQQRRQVSHTHSSNSPSLIGVERFIRRAQVTKAPSSQPSRTNNVAVHDTSPSTREGSSSSAKARGPAEAQRP